MGFWSRSRCSFVNNGCFFSSTLFCFFTWLVSNLATNINALNSLSLLHIFSLILHHQLTMPSPLSGSEPYLKLGWRGNKTTRQRWPTAGWFHWLFFYFIKPLKIRSYNPVPVWNRLTSMIYLIRTALNHLPRK